jgi:pyruvate-formate lyase
MNDRLLAIRDRLKKRDYRRERSDKVLDFATAFAEEGVPMPLRSSHRLMMLAHSEEPKTYPEDRFGFYRSIKEIPSIFTQKEFAGLEKTRFPFDEAYVGNIATDYAIPLTKGFNAIAQEIEDRQKKAATLEQAIELQAMEESVEAVFYLSSRYQKKAENNGNKEMAKALLKIPYQAPVSFYEALLMLRFCIFCLWLNGNKHITIGRFDQYLYPFYEKDIKNDLLNEEEALSLIEEFFLALNFDADLYPGIQQGDNGQSLVIGGVDPLTGKESWNALSKLVLEASLELSLIDPKINMRVSKNTSDDWYQLGTQLTKKGLGFPQYSNDDIVIPALERWGYEEKDARNYVVAACWEFIIPGKAMDVPNIDGLSFPGLVNEAISQNLLNLKTYADLQKDVDLRIGKEVDRLCAMTDKLYLQPSPFQSILMDGCIENAKDISFGCKYNNYGFHGVGISNGADALAAVKKTVYEEKTIKKEELLKALGSDFIGFEGLQRSLKECPKMGENDDYVDSIATHLLHQYALEMDRHKNARGGIFRPGTGSAMYYVWLSKNLEATADGRKKGEPFAANYSPSLGTGSHQVLSVVESFTKPCLKEVCNGGPLTLEFHDTVFKNKDGIDKVASLVKAFIVLGGHQLQLNSVNRDVLLDAQKHPELHKDLIVRVWGWSGYFNELDLTYQDHVIKRTEFE